LHQEKFIKRKVDQAASPRRHHQRRRRVRQIDMSEEKPVFKVIDRRLFNPDGTPREVEGREEDEAAMSNASAAAASASAAPSEASSLTQDDERSAAATSETGATATASAQAAPEETDALSSSPVQSATTASEREPQGFEAASDDEGMEDVPGADDPTSFVNFLMSVASNAAAALGMMEHPVTGQRGVDLPLGKHWIDVLGMLHEKTRGNLAPQEQQILEGILADLRMQFVSLTSASSARPSGPRGFTGRDIIGGK
jgi:hypothetical protein